MSFSRIALISVLVAILIGTLAIGGMLVYKQFPSARMSEAQRQIEAKDYESAIISLKKLLHKDPTNVEARLMLVETIRDYSESKERSRSFAANPTAVQELAKAAELRPQDMDLQRRLLWVYLQIGDLGKASTVAEQVVKDDPTNPDVHFALTWKAVEQKNEAKAEALFKQFTSSELSTPRIFQTFFLQRKYHWERENEEAADQVLADAAKMSQQLTGEQLQRLLLADRLAMLGLLIAYQERAEAPQEALDRAKILIDATKKLDEAKLADKSMLASAAAQSLALFNVRFPSIKLEPTHRILRDQLSLEAEGLGTGALEAAAEREQTAPLLVYWNTARNLMTRGEYDQATKVLDDGIAAALALDQRSQGGLLDLHLLAARVSIMNRDFDAADNHLNALIGDERFEGWSYLLKGSVALHQGRLQLAHEEFLKAKKTLGDKILVRMSLAHTHMAREEWSEAIELLSQLQLSDDQLTDEEKIWHQQLLGGGQRIDFDLLRARLALGQWGEAQANLAALKNTELAPNAWAAVVTYLWEEEKDKAKAKKYIGLVRAKYKDNLALAMLEARLLKEDGQSVAASKVIAEYANTHPDELSQLALARWQIRNRQPAEALAVLNQLASRSDLSPKAINTVKVYRVQALIGAQQFDMAKNEADELINGPGTATAGYLMNAALAFRERDEKRGVEMLEKARAANPNNPALNMMIQRIRSAQGDFDGVLELASGVAGIEKYQAQVQTTVGEALRNIAETQGAAAAVRKADELLAKQPNDLSLIVLKVDLQLSLGQHNEAMQVLANAQRNAPSNIDIRRLKAQAWMAQGKHAMAIDELNDAMQMEIDAGVAKEDRDINLVFLAAQAAIAGEQYADGVRFGDMARRAAPDSPRGFLLMAESYRMLNRIGDAAVVLEGYARRHPNDFAIHKTLANLYRQGGQTDKAIAIMERARANHPNDIRYAVGEIEMLLNDKRQGEARLLAQETIGTSQNIAHVLAVAKVFADQNQSIDAQNWGERALAVAASTNKAPAHSFLGRIYLRRARQENNDTFYGKARTQFELVRQTQPRDVIAGNNLAWLLATKFDQADEAVRVVEEVRGGATVEQLPPAFIDTMIDVYQRAGHIDKARELAKESVGHFPRQAPLLYRYGMLLAQQEPKQAKQMLARAVELGGLSAADEAEARRQMARL